MTAFLRVWRFTRIAYLVGGSLTVSLAGSKQGLPDRAVFRQGPSACGFGTAELPGGFGLKPLLGTHRDASLRLVLVAITGLEPAPSLPRRRSTTELNSKNPISTCAPRSLRRLLGREIRHADCLSPTGYSTENQDAGCSPEPRNSAHAHSLVRLVLPCTTRCPSRLTMSVPRSAPPRVLSRACIPGRAGA